MSFLLKLVPLKKRYQYFIETEIGCTVIDAGNPELPMPVLPATIRNYLEYCGYEKTLVSITAELTGNQHILN